MPQMDDCMACVAASSTRFIHVCAFCLHTVNGEAVEFGDVVQLYLGRKWFLLANLFSILTLIGACLVYWVLMTTFLTSIVEFGYDSTHNSPGEPSGNDAPHLQSPYWNKHYVPLYLALGLFPLLNLKNISFFTRFNSLGAFSIMYLMFFICYTTFAGGNYTDSPFGGYHMDETHVRMCRPSAFSLVGVLTLAYFIHNGSLSILRNARHPENNARDVSIAYVLVCATYLVVGICLYVSFNGDKDKIKQNFLENFSENADNYIFAFVAQCFLLLQFITVFPLLMFIIRFQTLSMLYNGNAYPGCVDGVGVAECVVLVALCWAGFGSLARCPHLPSCMTLSDRVVDPCGVSRCFKYAVCVFLQRCSLRATVEAP
eukprot:m.784998 g.784998  ORF g.784998 m.784998 type:complete len:371 (+) comp23301_c0_seq5:27-1139(+)